LITKLELIEVTFLAATLLVQMILICCIVVIDIHKYSECSFVLTLLDLRIGDYAQILGFSGGNPVYRQRLLCFGLVPGVYIRVARVAPLGDPIEIKWGSYSLSLRRKEAAILQVVREDGDVTKYCDSR